MKREVDLWLLQVNSFGLSLASTSVDTQGNSCAPRTDLAPHVMALATLTKFSHVYTWHVFALLEEQTARLHQEDLQDDTVTAHLLPSILVRLKDSIQCDMTAVQREALHVRTKYNPTPTYATQGETAAVSSGLSLPPRPAPRSPAIYDAMHECFVPPEFQNFPVVDDDGTASLWPRNSPDDMLRPLPSQKMAVLWQLHCPDKCMPPVAIPEPMAARLIQRSVRAAFTKMPRMKRDAPYVEDAQAGREPSNSPPSDAVVPDLQPSSPMSAKSTDSPRRGPDTPVDTPIHCPPPLASPLIEEMFRGLNLSAYDSEPASPVQRSAMFPGPEARDEEMPLGLYVDGDLQEQQFHDHSGMSLDGLGEGFGYLQNMDVQQEQLPTPPQSASTTDFPTSAFTFEPAHAPMPGFPSEPVPGYPSQPMHAFDHSHVPAFDFSLFEFPTVDEPAPPFTPSTSAPSSGSAYTPTDSSEHSSMGVDSSYTARGFPNDAIDPAPCPACAYRDDRRTQLLDVYRQSPLEGQSQRHATLAAGVSHDPKCLSQG
ncbi:uncharacterized protein SCHCODRAFT_02690269 [Schizophyllum commune H4-8]|uniref:Uncharacterized protein n=1 Tax=Schizophyllum commune (strain H4-8 / FGSC 9210) TaxID=578458 RepID=D8Q9T1_SCHCM|nr:uncharacterized protein SCHCODRAFT_02690269 [Schizophyllum commune H4-8]KAI5890297.1 hypothetical protein SCHCODRAFT_02690269 [Schizophyllum commune H4-8]